MLRSCVLYRYIGCLVFCIGGLLKAPKGELPKVQLSKVKLSKVAGPGGDSCERLVVCQELMPLGRCRVQTTRKSIYLFIAYGEITSKGRTTKGK